MFITVEIFLQRLIQKDIGIVMYEIEKYLTLRVEGNIKKGIL